MTKTEILENLEGQIRECYFNAALAKHNNEERGELAWSRRAVIISQTAGDLLGEKWWDNLDSAMLRARHDGVDQYRRLYNR